MGKRKQVKLFHARNDKKVRSLQSLHETLRFTVKRARTSCLKGRCAMSQASAGSGYGRYHLTQLKTHKNDVLMESGLIQMPASVCNFMDSARTLSISVSFGGAIATTASSDSSSGAVYTQMDLNNSVQSPVSSMESCPVSSLESCSSVDEISYEEEVVSLMCSADELGVLDFMAISTSEGHSSMSSPDKCTWEGFEKVEDDKWSVNQDDDDDDDDDGEPYRIDLCDFEPDVSDNMKPIDGQEANTNRGGVLSLRLDHEEVIRAWTEIGGCLDSPCYLWPSSKQNHLLSFRRHTLFVRHPPYLTYS